MCNIFGTVSLLYFLQGEEDFSFNKSVLSIGSGQTDALDSVFRRARSQCCVLWYIGVGEGNEYVFQWKAFFEKCFEVYLFLKQISALRISLPNC